MVLDLFGLPRLPRSPRGLAMDREAPALFAPALERRGAGARDRRGARGHRERGDREDPSSRHCPPVALRRRARTAAGAAKHSAQRAATIRPPARRLLAPAATSAPAP